MTWAFVLVFITFSANVQLMAILRKVEEPSSCLALTIAPYPQQMTLSFRIPHVFHFMWSWPPQTGWPLQGYVGETPIRVVFERFAQCCAGTSFKKSLLFFLTSYNFSNTILFYYLQECWINCEPDLLAVWSDLSVSGYNVNLSIIDGLSHFQLTQHREHLGSSGPTLRTFSMS